MLNKEVKRNQMCQCYTDTEKYKKVQSSRNITIIQEVYSYLDQSHRIFGALQLRVKLWHEQYCRHAKLYTYEQHVAQYQFLTPRKGC